MNNRNVNFYGWIRSKLVQVPPVELDKKILTMAKRELTPQKNVLQWIMPTTAIATCFILVLTASIYLNRHKNLNQFVLNEAPEMILSYNSIELMADASQLSEEDWKKIEGTQ